VAMALTDAEKYPRTGKRGAPQVFPRKLYELLSNEETDVIGWTASGNSFMILDMDIFTKDVLMKYFRHQKYSSFQRQLNLYGFRKIQKGPEIGAYAHESFVRGEPDLLFHVRRMPQGTSPANAVAAQGDSKPTKRSCPVSERARNVVSRFSDCFDNNKDDMSSSASSARAARQARQARHTRRIPLYDAEDEEEEEETDEVEAAEAQVVSSSEMITPEGELTDLLSLEMPELARLDSSLFGLGAAADGVPVAVARAPVIAEATAVKNEMDYEQDDDEDQEGLMQCPSEEEDDKLEQLAELTEQAVDREGHQGTNFAMYGDLEDLFDDGVSNVSSVAHDQSPPMLASNYSSESSNSSSPTPSPLEGVACITRQPLGSHAQSQGIPGSTSPFDPEILPPVMARISRGVSSGSSSNSYDGGDDTSRPLGAAMSATATTNITLDSVRELIMPAMHRRTSSESTIGFSEVNMDDLLERVETMAVMESADPASSASPMSPETSLCRKTAASKCAVYGAFETPDSVEADDIHIQDQDQDQEPKPNQHSTTSLQHTPLIPFPVSALAAPLPRSSPPLQGLPPPGAFPGALRSTSIMSDDWLLYVDYNPDLRLNEEDIPLVNIDTSSPNAPVGPATVPLPSQQIAAAAPSAAAGAASSAPEQALPTCSPRSMQMSR